MTMVRVCVLLASALALAGAAGNDTMAPLSQYMMSPAAEVALARSAAPPAISKGATIMVLGAHGYTVAQKGQNGFTCIVERGWMVPFGRTAFWSAKMIAPTCYNAAASRTVLVYTFKRTEMALAGASKGADSGAHRSGDQRQSAPDTGAKLNGLHDVEIAISERRCEGVVSARDDLYVDG